MNTMNITFFYFLKFCLKSSIYHNSYIDVCNYDNKSLHKRWIHNGMFIISSNEKVFHEYFIFDDRHIDKVLVSANNLISYYKCTYST